MPTEPALSVRGVSRRYGRRHAVREVSFTLHGGEVLLLGGPNGAGKTTLLRLLAGLLRPSSGAIERRGAVGLVAHQSMLYDALTARENLQFFARLYGIADRRPVDALLDRMGLGARGDEPIGAFSRGMVQRLAIARALLADPAILLLDEPLSHLDDSSSRSVLEVLVDLRERGRAIVLVAHQLGEVIELATSVGLLTGGRLALVEPRAGRSAAAVAEHFRAAMSHG